MARLPTKGLVGRFLGTTIATGAGFAWGHAAGPILRAPLREVANEANSRWSFEPLSPQTAAEAEIVGAYDAADVRRDASWQGLNATRANALRALAGQAPGFAQLAQLRNRGRITDAEFERGLAQLGIRDEWRDDVRALRFALPTGPELAEMAVQGVLAVDDARAAALEVGTSAESFDRYYRLAGMPPGAEQLLDLWNRRAISEDDVERGLRQSRLKPEWIDRYKALKRYLLPPSDVIRLAVREVYDPEKRAALDLDAEFPPVFAQKAALLGISEADARDLWAGHYELPSYSQAAAMLFRGEITREQFDTLLAALDYAPTWRDKLANIARAIPTVSDFQRLVRRGIYGGDERRRFGYDAEYPDVFTAKMALHGFSEADARDLWAGGWRMPSATQLDHMLWRGEITEDDLDAGLKALDYPVFWRDKLAAIARPTLGRIDLRRLYAEGVLTEADVFAGYRKLGFTEQDARRLADFAVKLAKGGEKEATAADFLALFNGHRIERDAALAALRDAGYSAEDAARKVDVLDARKVASAITTAIGGLHSAYKKHDANAAEVDAGLVKLGVAEWARAAIIAAWTVERDVARPELSVAQVVAAYRRAVITRDAALAELTSRDYTPERAAELLDTAALTLTVKQIQDAVDAGTLTRDQGLERLREQGYTAEDAAILLPEPKPETTPPPLT